MSAKCESHVEEELKDKQQRQVTALSDKSDSAMSTAATQRHCGVTVSAVRYIRR